MNPLTILFAGESLTVKFIDGTTHAVVHVRAMPQRFLPRVIECAEFKTALVELCTYVKAPEPLPPGSAIPTPGPELAARSSYPEIPPPAGYAPVPAGWTDNLSDASVDALYEKAKALNFQRAVDWARGQIAAKKMVSPLHEAAIAQVMPLLEKIIAPLMNRLETSSALTRSSPSSPVTPGSSS